MKAVQMNERESMYVQVLHSVGMDKKSIARRFGYKYMDVINVLRGNSFSHITGILHHSISTEELTVVKYLLKQGHPYREIASFTGIEDNKVRNIRGYLQYNKVI